MPPFICHLALVDPIGYSNGNSTHNQVLIKIENVNYLLDTYFLQVYLLGNYISPYLSVFPLFNCVRAQVDTDQKNDNNDNKLKKPFDASKMLWLW